MRLCLITYESFLPIFYDEDEIARMYQARQRKGRKSVSAERYDPTDDDLDVATKIVPKSDKQRRRLQGLPAISQQVAFLEKFHSKLKIFHSIFFQNNQCYFKSLL